MTFRSFWVRTSTAHRLMALYQTNRIPTSDVDVSTVSKTSQPRLQVYRRKNTIKRTGLEDSHNFVDAAFLIIHCTVFVHIKVRFELSVETTELVRVLVHRVMRMIMTFAIFPFFVTCPRGSGGTLSKKLF